jgi:dyslexia-associated protein KIAA0319-like protein
LRQAQLGALLKQVSLLLHGGASIILRSVNEEQNTGRAVISFLAGIIKGPSQNCRYFKYKISERQTPGGVNETLTGPQVVKALRAKLRQDSSLLDLPVARVETVICQNNCSNHGACDEATRQCLCEAFWMQDLFAQYAGDGESNCGMFINVFCSRGTWTKIRASVVSDWSILYVVVGATAILLSLSGLAWGAYCALAPSLKSTPPPKRLQRRKASYSLLGSHEEDETSMTKSKCAFLFFSVILKYFTII